jgi:hypothetical protein
MLEVNDFFGWNLGTKIPPTYFKGQGCSIRFHYAAPAGAINSNKDI